MGQHDSSSRDTDTGREPDSFRFLLSTQKTLLHVREVADQLRCGKDSVYQLIEKGGLEAHQGEADRSRHKVTSRSVLGHLAATAKYEPRDFLKVVLNLIKRLSERDRRALIEETKKL